MTIKSEYKPVIATKTSERFILRIFKWELVIRKILDSTSDINQLIKWFKKD